MIRKHVILSGDVQNRGFRETSWRAAKKLHLTGWVKNRVDRRVELEIQGEKEDIRRFLPLVMRLNQSVHPVVEESIEIDVVDDEKLFMSRR